MKFSTLETHLSIPRIHRYLQICTNQTRAMKLYTANLKLARDFHPLLGVLEVILRNQVYDVIADHFSDRDWIITQASPTGFMSHRSLAKRKYVMRRQVENAIKTLRRNGVHTISGSRVLAEQTFAFWTDLFEPHHFGLVSRVPTKAFRHLPPTVGRSQVADILKKIRKFRNRINHNEPIVFHNNQIDLSFATDVYDLIIDMFLWLDPDLIKFIKPIDRVQRTLSLCRKV